MSVKPDDGSFAMCELLGLDPAYVRSITVTWEAGCPARIDVQMSERTMQVVDVLRRYVIEGPA